MPRLFFLLVLCTIPASLVGQQICDGNLGENIFTAGDFGSGEDVVLLEDPGIAPGYSYTSFPPPSDGSYTITNNTGAWTGLFPTWLEIQDNSPDPNGYMMVVNASFETGLFYRQTIDGLCENTLYVFSADIINIVGRDVADHILPNVSFLLDGEEVFSTGSIRQTEQWNTYGFTFTTGPGVTSLELSLRNNAPGGIGNDLALDNISFRPCGPEALILPTTIANICEDGEPITLSATIQGDQYDTPAVQWQRSRDEGQSWEDITGENDLDYVHTELSSGFYYYRYLLANSPENLANSKCRVISNTKVVHVVPKFYTVRDTICQGLSYTSGTSTYTATGTYIDSLISSIGCDSIVTLELVVVPDRGIQVTALPEDPVCAGEATGSIRINDITNGTAPYRLLLDEREDDGSGLYAGLPAGDYRVQVTDRYGCRYEDRLTLVDPPPFTLDLGPDLSIELGERVDIQPNASLPINRSEWSPEGGIVCEQNCFGLQGFPIQSDTYTLTAYTAENCVAVDSIFIEVNTADGVFAPNVFSPNNDGVNDYFTVYGQVPLVQRITRLTILNRWGSVIYQATDLDPNQANQGWDGTKNGEPLDPDVFVWVADILFLDQVERRYSGDVLLVR